MRTPTIRTVIALVVLLVAGIAATANRLPDAALLVGVWKVDEISLVRPDGGGTNTEPQPGLFIFTRDHCPRPG